MGLDMYGYTMAKEFVGDRQVDVKWSDGNGNALPESQLNFDFAYWRKFNHLHGWMAELYYAKGGADEDFNCSNVRLDLVDLDRLESDIDAQKLQHTPGFFFGEEEICPEDVAYTREFIQRAREAINSGLVVFYDSWW